MSEMMSPQKKSKPESFLDYLVENQLIEKLAASRAHKAAQLSNQPLEVAILELGLLEEDRLALSLSMFLGTERVNLEALPHELITEDKVPLAFLKHANLFPLAMDETTITIATATPLEDTSARSIGYLLGRKTIFVVATISELQRHISQMTVAISGVVDEEIVFGDENILATSDAERLKDIASEAPTVRLLNKIIASAVEKKASDIHIEALEDQVRVRLRVDGALIVTEMISREMMLGLVSRVKILAKLNIAENRLPQDGRLRMAIKGREIDFRVSTTPTYYGEGVVLRILDRKEIPLQLDVLGFAPQAVQQLSNLLSMPNGIILVTGPTGSGKTTTLYAALSLLNRSEVKIFTVEDPIEYHIKGINQVLVRPQIGLDFSSVLRSLLRQDPDIMMVGEIRDSETAKIAVQASLTGHLVLSTLHTNSAVSAIARLRDLGVADFLIVSSTLAVIAQRLVRKLCEFCKVSFDEAGHEHALVEDEIFPSTGYKAIGCPKCNFTGYSGRTVVYEILEFDDALKSAIIKKAPDSELLAIAQERGMRTLCQNAVAKIRAGETSSDEVIRNVTGFI